MISFISGSTVYCYLFMKINLFFSYFYRIHSTYIGFILIIWSLSANLTSFHCLLKNNLSLPFHIKSIHRLLIIHFIIIITKIMDDHTTTSSSKLSTTNENSKTTNEMSKSTSTSVVGIPSSTADHTSIMPSIITQSWFNDHIQKVVSEQVSKLSEVIPLALSWWNYDQQ